MDSNDRNNQMEIANKFASAMMSFVDMDLDYFKYLRNRDRFYIGTRQGVIPAPVEEKPKPKPQPKGPSASFFPKFPRIKPPKDPVYEPIPIFDPIYVDVPVHEPGYVTGGETVGEVDVGDVYVDQPEPGYVDVPDGGQVQIPDIPDGIGEDLVTDDGWKDIKIPDIPFGLPERRPDGDIIDPTGGLVPNFGFDFNFDYNFPDLSGIDYSSLLTQIDAFNADPNLTDVLIKNPDILWQIMKDNLTNPIIWGILALTGLSIASFAVPFDAQILGSLGLIKAATIIAKAVTAKKIILTASVLTLIASRTQNAFAETLNLSEDFGVENYIDFSDLDIEFDYDNKKFAKGGSVFGLGSLGGYVKNAQKIIVGEGGEPELIIPVSKFGRAIESIYREGASVLISASIGFLNQLPNSNARSGVLAEANSLARIFGLSKIDMSGSGVGLTMPLKPFTAAQFIGAVAGGGKDQESRRGGIGINPLKLIKFLPKKWKMKLFRGYVKAKRGVKKLVSPVTKLAGKAFKGARGAAKSILKKGARLIGIKGISKIGGKVLGKSLMKKIPFLGLGAGLLFAGQRLLAGDLSGAGLEALSGLASTLPGLGTAVSVGLDATLAAKDMGFIGGDGATTGAEKPVATTPNPMYDMYGNPIILNPSTMKAWTRAVNAAAKDGIDLPSQVTSSFRSPEQQQALIDRAKKGDQNVFTPAAVGMSPHGQGWAVDINYYSDANEWMRENGHKFGFKWQGNNDPVHFDFWNNEPNDKWLQPGNRGWMKGEDLVFKKSTSVVTGNQIKPLVSNNNKELVNNIPVNQKTKTTSQLQIQYVPVPTPVPVPRTVYVPIEEESEVKNHVVIDVFGKGAKREVVAS